MSQKGGTYVFLFLAAIGIFFVPSFAVASQVPGGFPSGSVWVSKTTVVAGESIRIFVPVYDASDGKITGDVVFLVDNAAIGSTRFTLNAGETKIISFPWNTTEGTHTISAEIQNAIDSDSSAALSLSGEKAVSISLTVAAAPPQPVVMQVLSAAAGAAQNAISASVPVVSAVGNTLYAETETLRTTAQTALQNSLKQNTATAAQTQGEVLGAETYRPVAVAVAAPSSFSIMRILATGALFVVSYRWVFYPILLLTLLLFFYFIAKRVGSRPRREA